MTDTVRSPGRGRAPRATAVLAAAAVALLAWAAPAQAEAASGPADLTVALSGPATGVAGGSGEWTVAVANAGDTDASEGRVALDLPAGITLLGVRGADGWTCVMSPMSCELADGLAAGERAADLLLELGYDGRAQGRYALSAFLYQGEQPDQGLRITRANATVTISAPAASTPPTSKDASTRPAAQASSPTGPAPASTRTPATTPPADATTASAVRLRARTVPAAAPDEPAAPAAPPAADPGPVRPDPVERPDDVAAPPAALPFVAADEPAAMTAGAAASPAGEGTGLPALLALLIASLVLAGAPLAWLVARDRRASA